MNSNGIPRQYLHGKFNQLWLQSSGFKTVHLFPAVCNNLIAFSHFLCRPLLANTLKTQLQL